MQETRPRTRQWLSAALSFFFCFALQFAFQIEGPRNGVLFPQEYKGLENTKKAGRQSLRKDLKATPHIEEPCSPAWRDLRFAPTRLVDEPFGSELRAELLKSSR